MTTTEDAARLAEIQDRLAKALEAESRPTLSTTDAEWDFHEQSPEDVAWLLAELAKAQRTIAAVTSSRELCENITLSTEADNRRLRTALEAVRAMHDEREDMARALWQMTPAERIARDKCRPGPEKGENARAMFVAHGSPMRCGECNKPAPCPTARSFTASRPTPAPEATR